MGLGEDEAPRNGELLGTYIFGQCGHKSHPSQQEGLKARQRLPDALERADKPRSQRRQGSVLQAKQCPLSLLPKSLRDLEKRGRLCRLHKSTYHFAPFYWSPTEAETGKPAPEAAGTPQSSDIRKAHQVHVLLQSCPKLTPTCPKAHRSQQPEGTRLAGPAWPQTHHRGPAPIRERGAWQDGGLPRAVIAPVLALLCSCRGLAAVQGAATAGFGEAHPAGDPREARCPTPPPPPPPAPTTGSLPGLARWVPSSSWSLSSLAREVDVLHGQAEDLILAELLIWWMCGD